MVPAPGQAILEVSGLSAAYGSVEVLHDVDLSVPAGQLLCVLGPSGGGKSTLLRVVAGLEPARRGGVRLYGRDLAGVPAHERGIGLMFQDYALFPHRDVGQNVAFGLRIHGAGPDEVRARVAELLAMVGLPGLERRSVARLSGGEQQRVALARALAPRPDLLMLDEPMGSLDRSLRERLPEELRAIFAELGLTVIYVTHDQDEALSVADRVVILDRGRLVADGSPEDLWQRPPTEWVARFLGFRNVAQGRLLDGRLETPWGVLNPEALALGGRSAPAQGTVTVMLRGADVVAAAEGPIRGTVRSRRFGGDHVTFAVEVAGGPTLYVEARGVELPAAGEPVTLTVLPGGAQLVAPDPGPSGAAGAGHPASLTTGHGRDHPDTGPDAGALPSGP